jgi:hypothetical protein
MIIAEGGEATNDAPEEPPEIAMHRRIGRSTFIVIAVVVTVCVVNTRFVTQTSSQTTRQI